MTRVTIDADLKRKLHNLSTDLELCDETGQVLARVKPVINLSQLEPLTPDISEEETERRLSSNERRYTTQEVLDHLAGNE